MHMNTRIAKEMQGALTALIERPSQETYHTMVDYVEAFRSGYIEDDEYEELGYDPLDLYSLIDG
jgi:hypothetical protein